jgi:fatty aldehyde-generating acyl-ACP reductase
VILCARNARRLLCLAAELEVNGAKVEIETHSGQISQKADLVICAASVPSPAFSLECLAPQAIVCDAGYPKNMHHDTTMKNATIFFGGLGQITGGLCFSPDLRGVLNRHPFPDIAHGCLLEGMALALERRFEPFSHGRGGITPEKVEQISLLASRHGLRLAPPHNADGPLEEWNADVHTEHKDKLSIRRPLNEHKPRCALAGSKLTFPTIPYSAIRTGKG